MSVTILKGVGEAHAKLLKKIGIETLQDLVDNVPRDYDDYSVIQSIKDIRPGIVTIKATISSVNARYSKRGLHITEAIASDKTGSVKLMWFNQPYRARSVREGQDYFISGDYASNYKYLSINSPVCELVSSFPLHTARLVPKYRLTKGLKAHQLRKFTKLAFDAFEVKETLPKWLRESYALIGRREALFRMHFPGDKMELVEAKKRVGFDEVFVLMLASELNRIEFAVESGASIPFAKDAVKHFVDSLPYTLTDDQRRAAWQILQDMTKGRPMNRLLEGDVGSGKTVVAAISMLNAAQSNLQSVLMAPTEILAAQHANTLHTILPKSLSSSVVYLSGSMTASQKRQARERIADGDARIIIGTHALIQSDVHYRQLGLAVIDEQHRFGVEQRKELQIKAKTMPHVLNMTATPIPRSLMLTLYGEMDASIIAQKPPGRTPVRTKVTRPERRQGVYEGIKTELDAGRQLFVVCPSIEEQENPRTSRPTSVNAIFKQLEKWFRGYSCGLLHGKLSSSDKDVIMRQFLEKKVDVLVATTVIEVGVDIPNASVMVVEGADRFGLAQLHQLRGRIGRGYHASTCYLVPTDNDVLSRRLKMLESETDGFKLAEYDLELRGPGSIYGTQQHGELDFRVAKITDTKLIAAARSAAREFIDQGEKLVHYPQMQQRVNDARKITNLN